MGLVIRPLEKRDHAALREILVACGAFNDEEIHVALELFVEGTATGLAGPYALFGAESDGMLQGYVCLGRVLLTRSTWNLYWLAVHPSAQVRGVGRALQIYAESFIRSLGGERIVVETSSRADYERARNFYQRVGYTQVGLIRDFYRAGDDCLMFCKVLAPVPNA